MEQPPRIIAFGLPYDGLLSFFTRLVRMFNYGGIAPVFFLYLLELGLTAVQTGLLLSCILVGDLIITLFLSTRADRWGRKPTLVVGSLLKVLAGVVFASTSSFPLLVTAGIVGVISTSGGEIGPFIAIEQACLTDAVMRTRASGSTGSDEVAVLFGWYNALGYVAQACGALASGVGVQWLQARGWSKLDAYRLVFVNYGMLGAVMAIAYTTLSKAAEAVRKPDSGKTSDSTVFFGLRRKESIYIVIRLSVMFALDSFAGAFVMQTWLAFWFDKVWAFDSARLGYLLMAANVVAGASGIAAAYFVKRFGAMLTMIASHFPSNILLIAVCLMPSGHAAAAMLVARFCISQMDVPARQAYVAMVVVSDERSAAGGVTNIVRSLGASVAPWILGHLSSAAPGSWTFSSPFIIAGVLKCIYDVTLYSLYLTDKTMTGGEASAARDEAKREPLLAGSKA